MAETPDILKKIVAYKTGELAATMAVTPLAELTARLADREEMPRGFARALFETAQSGRTAIIAEVKKGSPSRGIIRAEFDPVAIAGTYEKGGATCLSVLTDQHFFYGHLRFLELIREQVSLPLLRKDFIFDHYQIYEARLAGADAILLIAAMLDLPHIRDFIALARELSLDVLLEVHDEKELEMALKTDCRLIGINNRSLHTFTTDLGTTERLALLVPPDRLIVAESGMRTRDDVVRLRHAGAQAFLIGECLMSEDDFGGKLRELLGSDQP